MNDARAVLDPGRLPWLTEDRRSARKGGWLGPSAWAVIAALLIGWTSYSIGRQQAAQRASAAEEFSGSTRIDLPEPAIPEVAAEPQVAVREDPAPAVAMPPVASPRATPRRITVARSEPSDEQIDDAAEPSEASAPARLEYWPADTSEGASGRLVRIGTFTSRQQAKRGWRQIVRSHPGLGSLRATVVSGKSLRNGKTYYRLQFGTTSQAHSEILCQRMRMIAQSCVVVGLNG